MRLSRRRPAARPTVALLAAATLLSAGIASSTPQAVGPAAPIAPELLSNVVAGPVGEPVRALVMLPNAAELGGGHDQVVTTLREHAEATQAEVEAAIEARAETDGVTVVNRFWITNMLLVEFPADSGTLDALAEIPGVARLNPNFELSLPDTAAGTAEATAQDVTWGLGKIEAERVWRELGVTGAGVRIATLDTGVAISHPDLAGKMVTADPANPHHPGGWMEFNASGGLVASAPRDSQYHGTHVAGTIHGGSTSGTSIGVAPAAEMMHGLVIPGGSGSFAQVAAGMQWAIAPTDAAGNPAGEPAHIVSMSLGGNGFHQEMIQPTRAMRAAGVFPAFAIGNNCGTSGTASPGNVHEAVGVGATDSADNVASFSCGAVVRKAQWSAPPADWPESWVKPDISAPGVNIHSADPNGGYRTLSGTSMATPHTSGVVALMMSASGGLSVSDVQRILGDTAFWDTRYSPTPPDTRFGRGRINAYEATAFVALDSGVRGAVTVASTGDPVTGATVTVEPGGRTLTTGADGTFTARLAPGTYTVSASAFGYDSGTVSDVVVVADEFTPVTVALTGLPSGHIAGRATLAGSGHGIPGAMVRVTGVPGDLSAVTAADGSYTIRGVPAGTYQVAATHPTFAAPAAVGVTVVPGAVASADFGFSPPPRSVAIVDSTASRAQQYVDVVFAPRGIPTAIYNWTQLEQAAQHSTVVLGYGVTTNYNAAAFQAFLDATDANGTGVIFTDHAFSTGNGIRQLSRHTGRPATTGFDSGGSGQAESYYEVTAEHPLFAGRQVGDRIVLERSTQAKWLAWFGGYEGEGRRTIATVGRTANGIMGGGIGVDQRANNRHVLLSTHGVSATRGPADWTPEATELFLNAATWASPPPADDQAHFAVYDLSVSPDVVLAHKPVTVSVRVKNVGNAAGTYDAVLRVGGQIETTTKVPLAAGAATTVTWTVAKDRLSTYSVQVGHLSDSFRVRAPIVTVLASTVDAPGATQVGPLAGATVELVADNIPRQVGVTDAAGSLSFEANNPTGRYTLVVRKEAADGAPAYLLHRVITVIDDDKVSFAPRVLAGPAPASIGENFAVRAAIDLAGSDARNTASVYLRPTTTGEHGYRFAPGELIATLDTYEAVTVHEVRHLEQDWFLPSQVITGLRWHEPYDTRFAIGGPASVRIGDVAVAENGSTTVDWSIVDSHGLPFETVIATNVRPFLTLPERLPLEHVEGVVRGGGPNELKPILRLFDPAGTQIRAGSVEWDAQPFTFSLPADAADGLYRLELGTNTGGYSGEVSAAKSFRVGPEPAPDVVVSDTRGTSAVAGTALAYDVLAANHGTAASGPLAWTVRLTGEKALAPNDVVLKLGTGTSWQRVRLTRDGSGGLVGTVVGDVALAGGAEKTWRLSLLLHTPGTVTVTDTFTGEGTSAVGTDVITVSPAPVGVG
ncbi:S8 family serine peptidase [Actinokineospora sp. 24-640]